MTKPTWTRGPWRAETDEQVPDRGAIYVEWPGGRERNPIAACDYGEDPETNAANASLIAAAPELFEALAVMCNKDAPLKEIMAAIVRGRAAIAKATGTEG